MHNALAQTCPMMIKGKWLFYWCYKYDMFHLSPSFRLFTRLFSRKFPFGECVIHRFPFIFFELKDIQDLLQQKFTYPKLQLCDYCRRAHYLLWMKKRLPFFIVWTKPENEPYGGNVWNRYWTMFSVNIVKKQCMKLTRKETD